MSTNKLIKRWRARLDCGCEINGEGWQTYPDLGDLRMCAIHGETVIERVDGSNF